MKRLIKYAAVMLLIIATVIGMDMYCKGNHTTSVAGKFYGSRDATDTNGNTSTYYLFKANDDSVWWSLTEKQIGFVPSENEDYILTYDNSGTTKANKPCDCAPELECECEVYDDIFLSIKRKKGK